MATKQELSDNVALLKQEIEFLKTQLLAAQEEKKDYQKQVNYLQDALVNIRAPEAYKDQQADRVVIPLEELGSATRAERNRKIFDMHTRFVQAQEEPLFRDPQDLEAVLEGVLFKNMKTTPSLHGNNES